MKLDWNQFTGQIVNVTMQENYGVVYGDKHSEHPIFYEIVFKTGKLTGAFDDGIMLEAQRDGKDYKIFIPYGSIKCVEIY